MRTIKKMTLKQLEFDFNAPKPKKPKFWKIGIYSIYREQGGDEEGGWAYDQMELVKGLKKSFTNKADAFKWARRINNLPSFKNPFFFIPVLNEILCNGMLFILEKSEA